jgi:hypothetical protein
MFFRKRPISPALPTILSELPQAASHRWLSLKWNSSEQLLVEFIGMGDFLFICFLEIPVKVCGMKDNFIHQCFSPVSIGILPDAYALYKERVNPCTSRLSPFFASSHDIYCSMVQNESIMLAWLHLLL